MILLLYLNIKWSTVHIIHFICLTFLHPQNVNNSNQNASVFMLVRLSNLAAMGNIQKDIKPNVGLININTKG